MIIVEPFRCRPVARRRVEIVERKGTGHPDTICDSIMEAVSVALSREYKKEFGAVLHHNIDKGLLAAGRGRLQFRGGMIEKPMELYIGDRATFEAAGRKIPVNEIAFSAAKQWLKENLRNVDPDRHVRYHSVLASGSEELTDIFRRAGKARGANDTSALVGFFPLSPTEKLVLKLERYLNSGAFKSRYPETGEDIKVMGLRNGRALALTVAMPLISRFITSERAYFARKEDIRRDIARFLKTVRDFTSIDLHLNALDIEGRGIGGIYLSILGTSAESADSGQVGRGNRVNGLISLGRPLGAEAAAGKNPVSHVGKIYNVLSHKVAEKICRNVEGIAEVYVQLLSRIGSPVSEPEMATAQVLLDKGLALKDISRQVSSIMEKELSHISAFCDKLAQGRFPVC
ncbi:MAG: methionine adenosyltransferase [Nitrospirae bacterium]|nr:methionine adenosyltransferase [Nitrospirota bacterium]